MSTQIRLNHCRQGRKLLLLLAFCALCNISMAQWTVGVRGGVASTSINRSHTDRIDEVYKSRLGFDIGVNARYTVNSWLAVRADLALMQRNHLLQRQLNYISPVYTDHINTYLMLPVMADFSFGGTQLRGHLYTGAFCGYWLSQHVKGMTYFMTDYEVFFNPQDEKRAFTTEDRRFNAGLACGLGLSYGLTGCLDLNLDALYYYDLLSHHKGYPHLEDYRYLNTASLTFGVTYKFKTHQEQ